MQHNAKIAAGAREEIEKRKRMISAYNDYVSKLRADTQAAREKSEAYIARERGEVIRGVETYDDPNAPGGQVNADAKSPLPRRRPGGSMAT